MAESRVRRSLLVNIEQELSCSICLDSFVAPKVLPCLHTFCLDCLRGHTQSPTRSRPDWFACPTCREEVKVPLEGVQGLKDDFKSKVLLGVVQHHLKKASRRPADERQTCERHLQEFKLFCDTCTTLLCATCVPEHNGHSISIVEKALDALVEKLTGLVKLTNDEVVGYDAFVESVQEFKGSIAARKDSIRDKITTWSRHMASNIENQTENMLAEVDAKFQPSFEAYDCMMKPVAVKSESIKEASKVSKSIIDTIHTPDKVYIMVELISVLTKLYDGETETQGVPLPPTALKYLDMTGKLQNLVELTAEKLHIFREEIVEYVCPPTNFAAGKYTKIYNIFRHKYSTEKQDITDFGFDGDRNIILAQMHSVNCYDHKLDHLKWNYCCPEIQVAFSIAILSTGEILVAHGNSILTVLSKNGEKTKLESLSSCIKNGSIRRIACSETKLVATVYCNERATIVVFNVFPDITFRKHCTIASSDNKASLVEPSFIHITPDLTILVSDSATLTVQNFTFGGQRLFVHRTPGVKPKRLSSKLKESLSFFKKDTPPRFTSITGVCMDDVGNVLYADMENNTISLLKPGGELIENFLTDDDGLFQPVAICIGPKNTLYVSTGNCRLLVYGAKATT